MNLENKNNCHIASIHFETEFFVTTKQEKKREKNLSKNSALFKILNIYINKHKFSQLCDKNIIKFCLFNFCVIIQLRLKRIQRF